MKKLLYALTTLCLLAGIFTSCEKEAEKAKSTIKGVVTDKETGNPLTNVTIELQSGNKQVQTTEDGVYIFENLKAGSYILKAQKDDYDDYENAEISLGVEQILTLDIEMRESICAIEGKVTDKKTGAPISDVKIELQPIGKQVQTTEDGTYRFDSLKVRKYTLKAQKEGYVDYLKEEIQLVADQTTILDVEMEEAFVEFKITDEEGNVIKEIVCDAPECVFNLTNIGNIAGEWRIETESEVDWITELSPNSGTLLAGGTQTITIKRKLLEEDKETVITIKTENEDLQLKIINKGFVMDLVYVEGGTFEMGATEEQGDDAEDDEYPVRTIKMDSYYIGKYEVTQGQWQAVMGTMLKEFILSTVWEGSDNPMYVVNWKEAQEFCQKLSEATGKKYVLPTEAQWEYAARGGNKSQHYKYAGSNDIDEVAWYRENTMEDENVDPLEWLHVGGKKKANELGVYDMSGNVWEWCLDWWSDYDENDKENPQGPANGSWPVLRGGGYGSKAEDCRVSFRGENEPDFRSISLGFRVVVLP